MLIGAHLAKLDPQGRLQMPSSYRSEFTEGFILTSGFEHCVFGYGRKAWDDLVRRLSVLPVTKLEARRLSRFLLGNADEKELQPDGQMIVPAGLQNWAELKENCVIAGLVTHIEIWSQVKWEQELRDLREKVPMLVDGMTVIT